MMSAFCTKCGQRLIAGDAFCRKCGAPTKQDGQEPAVTTVETEAPPRSKPVPVAPPDPPPVEPAPTAVAATGGASAASGLSRGGDRGRSKAPFWAAGVVVIAAAAAAALLAAGVFSGSSKHARARVPTLAARPPASTPVTTPTPTTSTAAAAPVDPAAEKLAVVAVLRGYATAYSDHSTAGLSALFSPVISRRGLASGGCHVSHGRAAVLAAYASQFSEHTGAYSLVGLSPSQVVLTGSVSAAVNATYRISGGGTGSVAFELTQTSGRWLIMSISATCS